MKGSSPLAKLIGFIVVLSLTHAESKDDFDLLTDLFFWTKEK